MWPSQQCVARRTAPSARSCAYGARSSPASSANTSASGRGRTTSNSSSNRRCRSATRPAPPPPTRTPPSPRPWRRRGVAVRRAGATLARCASFASCTPRCRRDVLHVTFSSYHDAGETCRMRMPTCMRMCIRMCLSVCLSMRVSVRTSAFPLQSACTYHSTELQLEFEGQRFILTRQAELRDLRASAPSHARPSTRACPCAQAYPSTRACARVESTLHALIRDGRPQPSHAEAGK